MATQLVDQPTDRTNRKVKYASWTAAWVSPAAAVAAAAVIEYLPEGLRGFQTEIALLMVSIVTAVGTWVAGYYTRARASE